MHVTEPAGLDRRGLLSGMIAYLIWGFFPLYFLLLRPSGPVEIIGHRILWSALFCLGWITVRRGWSDFRRAWANRALAGKLALAGLLITINWLTYIYAVVNDHVVSASLGYFINPLITVVLAVVFLHERLRTAQWISVGIGALAVLVISVSMGAFPWISIVLALSFGLYGLVKSTTGKSVGAATGLGIETLSVTPFALGYIIFLQATGGSHFLHHGSWHTLAMISAGPMTAIPLILFSVAARRLPLSTLGLMQYLAPCFQLATGVFILHEPMTPSRWAGFGLIWIALMIFAFDSYRTSRSASALARRADPV